MYCRAIPYEGREPYIFFSYSHKDADRVYPLLEQMVRDGFRVWYDDGNHPGDDWLENIGEHLNNCHICLAMLSANSEASHNCKKEVTFAAQCGKKLMAVKLEEFAMTVGMRLQLSTIHYLVRTSFPSDAALLQKLYESDQMDVCRQAPGSLKMRTYKPEPRTPAGSGTTSALTGFIRNESAPVKPEVKPEVQKEPRKITTTPEKVVEEKTEKPVRGPAVTPPVEKPVPGEPTAGPLVIVRLSDRTGYVFGKSVVRIGRSLQRCDLKLADNSRISNHHANIILEQNHIYLQDAGSRNGTFLDEQRLEPNTRVELPNPGMFRLYDETFLVFSGAQAGWSRDNGVAAWLRNPNTQSIRILDGSPFCLDRSHKWEDGSLCNGNISRKHAHILHGEGGFHLVDIGSKNGTYHNENRLPANVEQPLADGDQIRLVDTVLEFCIVQL